MMIWLYCIVIMLNDSCLAIKTNSIMFAIGAPRIGIGSGIMMVDYCSQIFDYRDLIFGKLN